MFQLYIPLLLSMTVGMCKGHGRLIDPPSRASAWRFGWGTPKDYNDNQGNCGGFYHQYSTNGGKCGICGDAWELNPRPHEAGGIYATGTIVREYTEGQVIPVKFEITANHKGHVEFRICPNNNPKVAASQACLNDHYLFRGALPSVTGVFRANVRLPSTLTCTQCVFQWRYVAGNNWGICEDGTGALGCGDQEEFRACADVAIRAQPSWKSNGFTETPSKTNSSSGKVTSSYSSYFTLEPEVTPTLSPAIILSPVSITSTEPSRRTTTRRPTTIRRLRPRTPTARLPTPPPTTTGRPEPIVSAKLRGPSCHATTDWQGVCGMDEWCVRNCNHVPPFCPASHCICD